jgi:hypothetical protein
MSARAAIAPKAGYKATKDSITIRAFAAKAYGHTDPSEATWTEMDPVVYWMRDNRTKEDTGSRVVWMLDTATQKEVIKFLKARAAAAVKKAEEQEADAK